MILFPWVWVKTRISRTLGIHLCLEHLIRPYKPIDLAPLRSSRWNLYFIRHSYKWRRNLSLILYFYRFSIKTMSLRTQSSRNLITYNVHCILHCTCPRNHLPALITRLMPFISARKIQIRISRAHAPVQIAVLPIVYIHTASIDENTLSPQNIPDQIQTP